MNIWLSSLRIRAHLSWRTGKHLHVLHVLHVLRTYSTCSYPGYQDTTTYAALQPLTNDHQWSYGGTGLLQIIIRMDWSFGNDHQEGLVSCNWSSWGSGLLQMIIWRDRPFANDLPDDLASCKWSFGGSGLLQMIIRHPCYPSHVCQDSDSISRTFLEQFALVFVAHLL